MRKLIVLLSILFIGSITFAQEATCPTNIKLALPRANAACASMENDELCYGNGLVEVTPHDEVASVDFSIPGSKIPAQMLREIVVASDEIETMSVATLRLSTREEGRTITMLLIGDVIVTDLVTPIPTIEMTTTGNLNIRAEPNIEADIIDQLTLRETSTISGISEDGAWLQVTTRENNQIGWVAFDPNLVSASDAATLDIVDTNSEFPQSFEIISVVTGSDDAPCIESPDSGLLIQTPTDPPFTQLVINDLELNLSGTVFIQAQSEQGLTLTTLDGHAWLETQILVPAGAQATFSTDKSASPEPYEFGLVQPLPVNNLPNRIVIRDPLSQDEIDTIVEEATQPQTTPVPDVVVEDDHSCRRITSTTVELVAGPGTFYETIRVISAGQNIYPILQIETEDDGIWWQLNNNDWISANAVHNYRGLR